MSLSMHEIAEKRQCKRCEFSDAETLEYNKKSHEAKQWADTKAWCLYPFKIRYSDDLLTCFMHSELGDETELI